MNKLETKLRDYINSLEKDAADIQDRELNYSRSNVFASSILLDVKEDLARLLEER